MFYPLGATAAFTDFRSALITDAEALHGTTPQ